MTNIIRVEPGRLGQVLRSDATNLKGVLRRGVRRGAQKTRTRLVRTSPVDRGILKNGWEVQALGVGGGLAMGDVGVELVNTVPYAGIMERGSRPFKMPRWVIEGPLAAWVKRKILGTTGMSKRLRYKKSQHPIAPSQIQGPIQAQWHVDDEAIRIAYAIARKFAKVGIKGRFWVRKNLPQATDEAVREIMREIQKYFATHRGTGGVGGNV